MALAIGGVNKDGNVEYAAVPRNDEAYEEVEAIAKSIRKRGFEAQVFSNVEWLYSDSHDKL